MTADRLTMYRFGPSHYRMRGDRVFANIRLHHDDNRWHVSIHPEEGGPAIRFAGVSRTLKAAKAEAWFDLASPEERRAFLDRPDGAE